LCCTAERARRVGGNSCEHESSGASRSVPARQRIAPLILGIRVRWGGSSPVSVTVDVFVEEWGAPESARPDVEQFSALYSATRTQLVRHCRWLLRGQGDPEVAAQEAFLKAWRAFDRYEQARPFWPWLATIARQVCYDQLRHEAVVRSHADTVDLRTASALDPEEHYELAEEGRLAMLALKRITPQQQRLVGLRDIEGWSYEHIAEFEGISIE